jgi:hypothetical protein
MEHHLIVTKLGNALPQKIDAHLKRCATGSPGQCLHFKPGLVIQFKPQVLFTGLVDLA